jgi:hypothetical protein
MEINYIEGFYKAFMLSMEVIAGNKNYSTKYGIKKKGKQK